MAGVAQLVEHRIVTPVVAGSIPVARPITGCHGPLAQLVEQETLNLLVEGSSPSRPTNSNPRLRGFFISRKSFGVILDFPNPYNRLLMPQP